MTTETVELPPLPRAYEKEVFATSVNTESVRKGYEMGGYVKHPPLFTADQMREYARQAVLAERERIAAEMEAKPDGVWANTCGHGIRRP